MELKRHIGEGKPGRLVVSAGPLKRTLLETHEATTMGFYDRFGDLHAVIYRIFTDDVWAFANKYDDDWKVTLARLGIVAVDPIDIPTPTEVRHVNDTRTV